MSEYLNNLWNNCTSWFYDLTGKAVENGLVIAGQHIEKVAVIVIAVGILLWILRYTKVFRWGIIGYLVGLLIELIGLAII